MALISLSPEVAAMMCISDPRKAACETAGQPGSTASCIKRCTGMLPYIDGGEKGRQKLAHAERVNWRPLVDDAGNEA